MVKSIKFLIVESLKARVFAPVTGEQPAGVPLMGGVPMPTPATRKARLALDLVVFRCSSSSFAELFNRVGLNWLELSTPLR